MINMKQNFDYYSFDNSQNNKYNLTTIYDYIDFDRVKYYNIYITSNIKFYKLDTDYKLYPLTEE